MTERPLRLHASTVAIDGAAVVIRGPSGSGKSSLALRLIDAGARLVADDQTIVERVPGGLAARAPESIAGKLEVRGLGIVEVGHVPGAPVGLVVDLAPAATIARLPEDRDLACDLLGVRVARVVLDASAADAAARVRIALARLGDAHRPRSATLVSSAEQ